MFKRALLAIVIAGVPAGAGAATLYVTDSLRLGIHEAEDTSDRPFDNLISGMEVEVLERNTNYARVKLPDGRVGWVKATFLVAEKPAAARVLELEATLAGLESDVVAARSAQSAAEQELSRLTNQMIATTGSAEAIEDTVERLRAENRAYEERFETYRRTLPLWWAVAATVVALGAGFGAGLWWLDALIRRRHGGFRVY